MNVRRSIPRQIVPPAPEVDSQPDEPVARLEHEIFKADAGRTPDPDLQRQYTEINEKFFQSALPQVPVLWEPRLREVGPLIDPDSVFEGLTDGHAILLSASLHGNDDKTRAVLCHEMVHVSFFAAGLSAEQHGQDFQDRLRALLDRGAFKGISAGDDEKRDLRASLGRESVRLDHEFAAITADARHIDQESQQQNEVVANLNARMKAANERGSDPPSGAELEQAKSRTGALQRRVSFFNERVTTANSDAKRFNDEASRYNLMMAYPDGLDEERLVRRKPPLQSAPVPK
ncbi:MAG TPA: SprT-like domain-containing protein [Vicinamibacterales bacterium]|jgi:predicted SprT family Zn-dependent metalloprotease|nr:SprT-like domain-containing protein [Vicinamibacterales bacterium]